MIHCLPGMGADHRMFPSAWNALPDLVRHDWPKHAGERTLREKAETLVECFGIKDGDILVGASLGGMVGAEIARLRKLQMLFLVGSAVHPEEIGALAVGLHPLSKLFPVSFFKFVSYVAPGLLFKMFRYMEPEFFHAMCPAIFSWQGARDLGVPTFRIHGRRDWVISRARHVDLWLDGGHLVSMSRAPECVAYVSAKIGNLPVR